VPAAPVPGAAYTRDMSLASLLDRTPVHFLSAGNPVAASAHVLLVHGLGEHIGRYAALVDRLVHAGCAVTAYDQRGHGQSGGPRGRIPRDDALLADLAWVIDHVRSTLPPACPIVLLGHSMGGTVVARFVAEGLAGNPAPWYRQVQGLVVSSPAWAADLGPLQRLLLGLGRALPDAPAGNGLKPAWISRDPAVVRAYAEDPLVHDRITPRLARFILDAGRQVVALAPRWTVPTLLMWAGADRCVAPRGAAAFAAAAPAGVVRSRCFEGLYHEIFNEPEREAVFAELLAWLDFQRASGALPRRQARPAA
jgi:alpha-beta hydrolase superfamily lysophospholipase